MPQQRSTTEPRKPIVDFETFSLMPQISIFLRSSIKMKGINVSSKTFPSSRMTLSAFEQVHRRRIMRFIALMLVPPARASSALGKVVTAVIYNHKYLVHFVTTAGISTNSASTSRASSQVHERNLATFVYLDITANISRASTRPVKFLGRARMEQAYNKAYRLLTTGTGEDFTPAWILAVDNHAIELSQST